MGPLGSIEDLEDAEDLLLRPLGTYPVPSATSVANRGSLRTSSITSGVRVASTQPAIP